ncbi:hypothetical protein [Pseudomonas typographi]|uniref:Lipoprotein n=1 Tax=Pseudomonas typographi TaxID=2715964 RepID=A0ABR7Z1N1_9PSED|nr:hypothetical protein [Pseudomonas typographi]MBD1551686.1 hypothetical protein [Pseudomonas typographi]MBD1587059.1 hypothetical protein [Pseudomonas typographi]MBD1599298.1 hypothetical protein [Pseudomonas typographi]
MKNVALGLIVAGLLAGCSSTAQQPGGASFTASTAKAPQQYADCLLPKWQAWRPEAQQSATDTGVKLTATAGFTHAYINALVDREGDGSSVKLFVPIQWQESTAWTDMAKQCL